MILYGMWDVGGCECGVCGGGLAGWVGARRLGIVVTERKDLSFDHPPDHDETDRRYDPSRRKIVHESSSGRCQKKGI